MSSPLIMGLFTYGCNLPGDLRVCSAVILDIRGSGVGTSLNELSETESMTVIYKQENLAVTSK